MMVNSAYNETVAGDVNPYAVDWINDPFAVDAPSTTDDSSTKCPPWQPVGIVDIYATKIRVCDDHIVVDEKVSIFRVNYFEEKLSQLEGFQGHVPRWYLPHIPMVKENLDFNVTCTVIIIDKKKENYADIGFDWPPLTLKEGEIMLQQGLVDAIGAQIGDKISIPLNLGPIFGEDATVKLLALMCFELEGSAYVDFKARELVHMGERIALADFGLNPMDITLTMDYTIT